jgi:hypothetical protein
MLKRIYATTVEPYGGTEATHGTLHDALMMWRDRVDGHKLHGGYTVASVTREPMMSGIDPERAIGHILTANMTRPPRMGHQTVSRVTLYAFTMALSG